MKKISLILISVLILASCNRNTDKATENASTDEIANQINSIKKEIIALGQSADKVNNIDDALDFLKQYFEVVNERKTFKNKIQNMSEDEISPEAQAAIDKFRDDEVKKSLKKVKRVLEAYRSDERFMELEKSLKEKYDMDME